MEEERLAQLIMLFIHIGLGWFLAALSVPFIRRKVKPNWWWGFIRTRRMVENPDVWYPVNEYAGRGTVWIAVITTISAIVCFFLPIEPMYYTLSQTALLVLLMIVLVVMTFRYMSKV